MDHLKSLEGAEAIIKRLTPPKVFLLDELLNCQKLVAEEKSRVLAELNQAEAKRYWICETIISVHILFQEAFTKLKLCEYYKAWCDLERCELAINALLKHYEFTNSEDANYLNYVNNMVSRWQSLFPYKVFFSPEFIKRVVICSTCGSQVKPRTPCGHSKGEIYNGEMCTHIIKACDMISISIVENPVQKYSVAFLSSENGDESIDHYDYSNLKFIVDRLESPYHEWRHEVTKRKIKRNTVNLSNDANCPCLSGSSFGECCATKDEFFVPHLQLEFFVDPPTGLPTEELLF